MFFSKKECVIKQFIPLVLTNADCALGDSKWTRMRFYSFKQKQYFPNMIPRVNLFGYKNYKAFNKKQIDSLTSEAVVWVALSCYGVHHLHLTYNCFFREPLHIYSGLKLDKNWRELCKLHLSGSGKSSNC